jgi:hypothetical protein
MSTRSCETINGHLCPIHFCITIGHQRCPIFPLESIVWKTSCIAFSKYLKALAGKASFHEAGITLWTIGIGHTLDLLNIKITKASNRIY